MATPGTLGTTLGSVAGALPVATVPPMDVTNSRKRPASGRGALHLLSDRRFGPYLATNFTSNIGNWFQSVAAGIVIFSLTGSNTLVGFVSVLQFVGTLALAPWSGSLADRFDRRRLLLLAQVISAAGAIGLAIWVGLSGIDGLPGVWPVFAASGVIGLGYALGISAMNALVPALVEPEDLGGAIALNSGSFTLARAVGPAVAGVVVAAAGAAWAFGINALTFIPLVVVLAVITPRAVVRSGGDRSVRAGLAYVRQRPEMLWLVLATLTVGWAADPVNTLSPAYADLFGLDESFVGFQVAAFGLGAALTTIVIVRVTARLGLEGTTRLGQVILGAGLLGFAIAPAPAVVLVALLVAGSGFVLGVTTTNTNLQNRLDEDMRGRVMALWSMAFLGSRPLAAITDGATADLFSPRIGVAVAIIPLFVGWWAIGKVTQPD